MQTLLTLLVTALQLKVLLLGLPVEFQSTKDQILPVVENAISYAQAGLAQLPASPTPIGAPQPSQPLTSTITVATPVSIDGLQNEYTVYGGGCSKINFSLHVVYSDGSFGASDIMTMNGTTTPYSASQQKDRSLIFSYVPQSTLTDEMITFFSGDLRRSTIIHTLENPFLDEQRLQNARQQGANIQIVNGKCLLPVFDVR
jgi:hypothetical protein